jgi:hypothetical protein
MLTAARLDGRHSAERFAGAILGSEAKEGVADFLNRRPPVRAADPRADSSRKPRTDATQYDAEGRFEGGGT